MIGHKTLTDLLIVFLTICMTGVVSQEVYACSNDTVVGVCDCIKDTVYCTSRHLKSIPQGIPFTTTHINLSNNDITEVPMNFFRQFKDLIHLFLGNNQFSIPFLLPKSLQTIDLSSNNITEIPRNFFMQCKYLRRISVYENQISKPFNIPRSIQIIQINRNRFTEVGDMIAGLGKLLFLNAEENQISKPIELPKSLKFLSLQRNHLNKLPEELLFNVTVKYLDISGNGLKQIPTNFFHGMPVPTELFMFSNELEVIPKDLFKSAQCGLSELYIFNNKIKKIEDYAFEDCSRLSTIHAFSNQLANITTKMFFTKGRTIKTLNVMQNPIKSVEHGAADELDPHADMIMTCDDLALLPTFTGRSIKVVCVQPSTLKNIPLVLTITYLAGLELNGHGFDCSRTPGHIKVNCKPCEPGFYGEGKTMDISDDDQPYDKPCKAAPRGGFYQDKVAQTKLEKCHPGTFVKNGSGISIADCKVCASGTNTSRFAGYRGCYCLENFHRTNRFGECTVCNKTGIICIKEYQQLQPGYWWSWDATPLDSDSYRKFIENIVIMNNTYDTNTTMYSGEFPVPYPCLNADACLGSNEGDVTASCREGYSDQYPLCSVCTKGYYKWSTTCKKCPDLHISILVYVAIAACISVIIAAVYFYRKQFNREGRTVADVMLARFKICLGFYQVLAGLLEALRKVRWPSGLVKLGNIFSFIELNFVHIASPRCIWEQFHVNAYVEFYMAIGIPLVVILSMISIYFMAKICIKRKGIGAYKEKSKSLKKVCFRIAVLILFTMYPIMCSKIFALLPPCCRVLCSHHSEKIEECPSFLKNDYSISCKDSSYLIHKVLSIVMAFIVAGMLPVTLLILLMKVRPTKNSKTKHSEEKKGSNAILASPIRNTFPGGDINTYRQIVNEHDETVEDEDAIQVDITEEGDNDNNLRACTKESNDDDCVLKYGLRFLYENYTDNCWYWEILEIIRKIFLTSVVLFFGAESRMQIGFAMVSSVIFLLLHGSFQPMKNRFEYWLQVISLGAIAINLSIGVLLLVPEGNIASGVDIPQDSLAINVLMYVVNGWIILVVVGAYLYSVGKSCIAFYKHPQCNCECCIAFILPTQHFIQRIEHCSSHVNVTHLSSGPVQTPTAHGHLKPNKSACPCCDDQSDVESDGDDHERERLIQNQMI